LGVVADAGVPPAVAKYRTETPTTDKWKPSLVIVILLRPFVVSAPTIEPLQRTRCARRRTWRMRDEIALRFFPTVTTVRRRLARANAAVGIAVRAVHQARLR